MGNRPPLSLTKMIKHLGKKQDRTVVAVTTITDDERLYEVPKLTVAALKFTESARARIVAAGGSCLTLDELIMQSPSGSNCLLLRANKDREAKKHWANQECQALMPSHTASREEKREQVSTEHAYS